MWRKSINRIKTMFLNGNLVGNVVGKNKMADNTDNNRLIYSEPSVREL